MFNLIIDSCSARIADEVTLQYGIPVDYSIVILECAEIVGRKGNGAWADVRKHLHNNDMKFTQNVANCINNTLRKVVIFCNDQTFSEMAG